MISVLIVEDDPMVAELNKRYVENVNGFKVMGRASNGEEALRFLNNAKIDLIILDIYMPQIDGIGFLKELRKRFIKTDVILVTAAQEAEHIDEALRLGAVDYLIKPFEFERLKNALDNYFTRYQLLRRQERFKQEDIDRITKNVRANTEQTLQKGLHVKTLERVRNSMKKNKGNFITSEEIADQIGMSRVTVRRYVEYLVSIGEMELKIEYGSVGRPSHKYKYSQT